MKIFPCDFSSIKILSISKSSNLIIARMIFNVNFLKVLILCFYIFSVSVPLFRTYALYNDSK